MDPLAGHQAALGHWLGTGLTSSFTSPSPKAAPPTRHHQDASADGGFSYFRRADSIGYDVPPYTAALEPTRSQSITSPHPTQPALSAAYHQVSTTPKNRGSAVRMGKPDGLRGFGDLGPDVNMQETSHRQKGRGAPFGSQATGGEDPDPLSAGPESRAQRKQQFASALKSVLGEDATASMGAQSTSVQRQQSDVGLVREVAPYASTVASVRPSTSSSQHQLQPYTPQYSEHYPQHEVETQRHHHEVPYPSHRHEAPYPSHQHEVPYHEVPYHEESIDERRRRYRDKQQHMHPQHHTNGYADTPSDRSVDVPQYTVVQTYDHPYRQHEQHAHQEVQVRGHHQDVHYSAHREQEEVYSRPLHTQQPRHHVVDHHLHPYPNPTTHHNESHEGRSVHFVHDEPQYVDHHNERGPHYAPTHDGGYYRGESHNVPTAHNHDSGYSSVNQYNQQHHQGPRFNAPPAHYDPVYNRYFDDMSVGADEYQPSEMDGGERGGEIYDRPSHNHSTQHSDQYNERQPADHPYQHHRPSSSGASVGPVPSAVSHGHDTAPDAYSAQITPVVSNVVSGLPRSDYVAQPQVYPSDNPQPSPSQYRGALANYRTVSGVGPRVPRQVVVDYLPQRHVPAISRVSSLGIKQVATTPEEDAANPLLEAFRTQTDSRGPTPNYPTTANEVAPTGIHKSRSGGSRSALETPLPWMHHLLDEEQADAHSHWIKTGMAIELAATATRSAQVSAMPSQRRAHLTDAATNVTRLHSIADSVPPRRVVDTGTAARTPSGRSDVAACRVQSERPLPPDMPPPASPILDSVPQTPLKSEPQSSQHEASSDVQLLRAHEVEKQKLLQEMYTLQQRGKDKEAALLQQIEALANERAQLLTKQQQAVVDTTPQRPPHPPPPFHSAPKAPPVSYTESSDQSSPTRSLPALSGHNRQSVHGASPAHSSRNEHTPDSQGPKRRDSHAPKSPDTARSPASVHYPAAIRQSPRPRDPETRDMPIFDKASTQPMADMTVTVHPHQSSMDSTDSKEDPAIVSLRNTLAQLLRQQRQLLDRLEGSKGEYEEAVSIRTSLERAANNEEMEHARLVAMEEEEIARVEAKLQGLKIENRQLRSDLRRVAA